MQVFIIACLVAVAAAARLDNTYLPPQGARGAGGSGSFLSGPLRGAGGGSNSGAYGAPGGGAGGHSNSGAYGGGAGGHGRSAEAGAKIIRFDNDNDGLGRYSYQYETENRIKAQEAGELKNAGSESEGISAHGSYSYTGPDGQTYTINYIADENGFQPSGEHLPTSPPIPEAILKSLQLNAAEEAHAPSSGAGFGGQYQAPSSNFGGPRQQSFNPQSGYKY